MENTLSSKEIDLLVDALDAWERKDLTGKLMSGMLKGMFAKDDPVLKAKMEEEERIENEKEEKEARQRKETALMLKAKLIGIKQSREISAMAEA